MSRAGAQAGITALRECAPGIHPNVCGRCAVKESARVCEGEPMWRRVGADSVIVPLCDIGARASGVAPR